MPNQLLNTNTNKVRDLSSLSAPHGKRGRHNWMGKTLLKHLHIIVYCSYVVNSHRIKANRSANTKYFTSIKAKRSANNYNNYNNYNLAMLTLQSDRATDTSVSEGNGLWFYGNIHCAALFLERQYAGRLNQKDPNLASQQTFYLPSEELIHAMKLL